MKQIRCLRKFPEIGGDDQLVVNLATGVFKHFISGEKNDWLRQAADFFSEAVS